MCKEVENKSYGISRIKMPESIAYKLEISF